MTPVQHYAEAEHCLSAAVERYARADLAAGDRSLRLAQVHATLATAPAWFGDEPPAPTGDERLGLVATLERLPELVKAGREAKGLSQRALGELTGIAYADLCRFENGGKDPRLSTVIRLARWLDGAS